MRLAQVFILCGVLLAIALGLAGYKVFALQYPLYPNEESKSWRVEAKMRFYPEYKKPVQVHFFKPQSTAQLAVVDENVVAPDYGIIDKVGTQTGNRTTTLTRREARGQQFVFYQAILYEIGSSDMTPQKVSRQSPDPVYVPRKANSNNADEVKPVDAAMLALIDEARGKSADNVSFAVEIIKSLKRENDDRVMVVARNFPNITTLAGQAALLINAADIPARIVNGIELVEHKRNTPLVQWLEVFMKDKWVAIDVANDKVGVADNMIPWWRGDAGLVRIEGGTLASVEISVMYNREDALTQAQWKSSNTQSWVSSFSLFELPIDTQMMFGIVLMIPLGGLVIVLLRQIVGLPTFGTFMPVLIALSFRETGLVWGVVLFSSIVFIGLSLRAYFDQLRLLVVPRLASVLTIVVLLIAAMTIVTFKLGINAGLSITLFPMIILTMMIERMALLTEEFGAKEARKTAYGSLIAASLAHAVMSGVWARHLVFVFPELLLIVLACTILLGRYNGYKLSEYFRFKKLARAIAENEKRSA